MSSKSWLTNFAFYFFYPTDFVSVSQTNSANVSLKISGALVKYSLTSSPEQQKNELEI